MVISFNTIVNKYNLKINGIIHVGAHFGTEYEDYEKLGVKKVMFFEPVTATYNQLTKYLSHKLNSKGIICHKLALGSETGSKEMFIETVNQGQSSSLLAPKGHLKYYPEIKFPTKEVVKVERLDNIEFNRGEYNMINIDVQGYELEVFKGAVKTLETIDIIYTEINLEELYENCVLVKDLDIFLKKFGFIRILTQLAHKSWGDALYLKY
jgi:FkbM family methyltransferase